ncbi:radical SAM protein [candidate division KSB3 bacterium]|uniref:Radical SAM protein n=1 Tax=candidate division KSB3 bacterium TaxID=2044937 RepID=A0A9D5JSZ0_9BACT|nr:radical SAM protein [candidate division KSB3 bacterium]MBD3323648.1 radical SAM protein [candidate division KSB3 bacterium]
MIGSLQTSRGCPFECEFCSVQAYAGRRQRYKPLAHILKELDVLYTSGYRNIFLVDDNLTANRRRAKELLTTLRAWNNQRPQGKVRFVTEVSLDIAREDDILSLCAEAGLTEVLIGIETPNEKSLQEINKRQNIGIDLKDSIQRFVDHNICVIGHMMVGFDADTLAIFEQQCQFAMTTPIPIFLVWTLMAAIGTPSLRAVKTCRAGCQRSLYGVMGYQYHPPADDQGGVADRVSLACQSALSSCRLR